MAAPKQPSVLKPSPLSAIRRTCACVELAGAHADDLARAVSALQSHLEGEECAHHAHARREDGSCVALLSFPSSAEATVMSALTDVPTLEVAATCPCLLPVNKPTKQELILVATEEQLHACREKFLKFGVLIHAEGALTDEDMRALRALVKTHCEAADEALARRGISGNDAKFDFREISSRGGLRFDQILASGIAKNNDDEFECLPPSHTADDDGVQALVKLARTAAWIPLVDSVLGEDDWKCQCSAVYSRRGAPDQRWHSDGAHVQVGAGYFVDGHEENKPHPLSGMGGEGEASPYAVCVFVALDACGPSTNGIGATSFWPGSHARESLVGFGGFAEAMDLSIEADLHPGGFVVYDYRLLHKGMAFDDRARTRNESNQRSLLQFVYHKPWYKERRNYGQESLFEER